MWKYKTTTTLSNVPKSNRLNKVCFVGNFFPPTATLVVKSHACCSSATLSPPDLSYVETCESLHKVGRLPTLHKTGVTRCTSCWWLVPRFNSFRSGLEGYLLKKICTLFFSVGCLIVSLFGFTLSSKTQTWRLFLPRKLLSGCRLIPVHTH